jgi:FlaA1/EpsC-like NDP-sugar epimerase
MLKYLWSASRPVLILPRYAKRMIALSVDISLCVLTVWLAFYLRLGELVTLSGPAFWAVAIAVVIALPIFVISGLYRAIFRYSGFPAMFAVARAIAVYGLLYASAITAIGVAGIPRTVGLIQPLLLFFAIGGSRALARYWLGGIHQSQLQIAALPRTLVYGAGSAGRQLASALENSFEMRVAGFLDDDDRLHGHVLNGQPIFSPDDLGELIESKGVTHVLMAMPSASRRRRNEILKKMSGHHVAVRTLPSLTDLAEGRVTTSDLRDLDIDDLLGREAVASNHILLAKNISARVVLVTGAGGSIGGELCRQIIKLKPEKLLLVDISEFALYAIHSELEGIREASGDHNTTRIVPLLASVQDEERMREIMDTWLPETVYHAAAYKHVPLVEHNLAEGVKNNVIGTLTTAQVAIEKGVSDFVLISTDKAVRPTNVMGASKRLAELCLQALYALQAQQSADKGSKKTSQGTSPTQSSKTKLSMVRFGNVLDSSGSVIPKFRKQIRDGGPITLTHPEITRYFMTIPEAAQLVIQAGAMAKGGDVFVLDMGESVKIADLARRMIELSGLSVRDEARPDGDIEIVITGLRPGEKLYEELMLGDDPKPTMHPKIQRAQDPFIPWHELEVDLETLKVLLSHNNVEVILTMLQKLVTGYQPNDEVVDWVFSEQVRQSNGTDASEVSPTSPHHHHTE